MPIFIVQNCAIEHDGARHEIGAEVDLTDSEAATLLASGVIEYTDAAEKAAAAEQSSNETPADKSEGSVLGRIKTFLAKDQSIDPSDEPTVLATMQQLRNAGITDDRAVWTKGGLPHVENLQVLTGVLLNKSERDRLWAMLPPEND